MKFSSTSYAYGGRVNDEIWISSGLRGIARRRIRPVTRETKFQFRALFSLEPARAEWANLGTSTQAEWNDLAEVTFGWPLQGSPRYMSGEDFFANYYTVLLTLDEYAPLPDVPSGGPAWQSKPQFYEFAEWVSDVYTLKAKTDFDFDTVLLFSGLPPTTVEFKPEFQREVFIGSDYVSLSANDEYDGVHYMMEDTFGTITSDQKIWGRVWEVQDGYIRTLKDPCTPDPSDTPPPASETSFEIDIYNDHDADTDVMIIYAVDASYNYIGTLPVSSIGSYTTETVEMELDEGYNIEDVDNLQWDVTWMDLSMQFGSVSYDQEDPFPLTIIPDF